MAARKTTNAGGNTSGNARGSARLPNQAQQLVETWTGFGKMLTNLQEQHNQLGMLIGTYTGQQQASTQQPPAATAPAIPETGVQPVRRQRRQKAA